MVLGVKKVSGAIGTLHNCIEYELDITFILLRATQFNASSDDYQKSSSVTGGYYSFSEWVAPILINKPHLLVRHLLTQEIMIIPIPNSRP